MIRAYCFASGHIGFGRTVPYGAVVIARGHADDLKAFIAEHARSIRPPRRLRGAENESYLLVPGVPEAETKVAAAAAFEQWVQWISAKAPREVRVLPRSMGTRASMITARAEAWLREIELTAGAERLIGDIGIYADRQQVLTNLRRIKVSATAAETLLRALDRAELLEDA